MLVVDSSDREAHHQVAVRSANEVATRTARPGDGDRELVVRCECGDAMCDASLRISGHDYAAVRTAPCQFLVVDRHENPEISVVVITTDRFSVVETVGRDARRIVRGGDPSRAPRVGSPHPPARLP